jgi:hypothetical protein
MLWCFLWRCGDWICLWISISFLTGREHIRIWFGWPNFARCPRYRRSLLRLRWQKNWSWRLSHCHKDLSVVIVCLRLGAKVSSGIIDVLKGWMPVAQNLALMLAGVAVVSPATLKILPDLGLLSVGCVLWLEQHNLFTPVTLKWSKDRFIHRLQFTGILTWKAGQCSMAVCSSTLVWWCDVVSSDTSKQGPYNDWSWMYCVK